MPPSPAPTMRALAHLALVGGALTLLGAHASAQDDTNIDYYVHPIEELELDDELKEALENTQRLFHTRLMEAGPFREHADPDTLMRIGQCNGDNVNPTTARRCELELASDMHVDWVFEFDIDDFGHDDYFVSVTLWNPATYSSEFTFGLEAHGRHAIDATRDVMPELASRIAGSLAAPTYIRLQTLNPSSAVFTVGGEPVELAPLGELTRVLPGEQTLAFAADGYQPWTADITFEPGDIWELNVDLEPNPVEVSFTCNVDLEIEVDGEPVGSCSRRRGATLELSPRAQRLRAVAEGHTPFEGLLTLVPGRQNSFDLTLEEVEVVEAESVWGEVRLTGPGSSLDARGMTESTHSMPSGCAGYRGALPSYLVHVDVAATYHFEVSTGGDAVLAIEGPGGVVCDDDGGQGLDPMIEHYLATGTYRVWVGGYYMGNDYPFALAMREGAAAPADSDMDGIPDSRDSCIYEMETINGYQDGDGCPDTYPTQSGGGTCLADSDCGSGADCVSPGICRSGAARETMTYTDVPASMYFSFPNGTCTSSADCGPWVCGAQRVCVAPEAAGRAMPLRADIRYWDGSCVAADDCGAWTCSPTGWCRDPATGDD